MLSKIRSHKLSLLSRRTFTKAIDSKGELQQQSPNEQLIIQKPKHISEFGPGKDPYSTFPEETKSLLHRTFKDLTIEEEKMVMLS